MQTDTHVRHFRRFRLIPVVHQRKMKTVPLSAYSLDTFVAPHMSKLTLVGAPSLESVTGEYCYWVNNFILNTIFHIRLEDRKRQLFLYFLRKVEGSFQEYEQGRHFLATYIEKPGEAVSAYFHALRHFEVATILAYHAYDTFRSLTQEKLYVKGDGSALQRLNRLQNISKHANQELGRGTIPDNLSTPIWLTNTGIESHDAALSFEELSELLKELAGVAEVFSKPQIIPEIA
ncbi:MAG: hypothetical protein RQ754_03735 [Desulfuromonadales bacterium]|nr:hypothetical protein [Desulfuromonadales bacterium]